MNPILLKTLISLAASNKKPAPAGTVGSDAQLKNRIVLFADEAVNLPDWGIAGLPAMILGAAPQTCLFVSDLDVSDDAKDPNDTDADASDSEDDEKPAGSVSFSLTIKAPPAPGSSLHARTIVWKLSLPIAGFRDVQTGTSSTPVHAPVIRTRIKLGGLERDVELGLLEMGGLDQPLLIGKDTLADKFLIRPDRPDDQKAPALPSVDLNPPAPEAAKPKDPADQPQTSDETPAPADNASPTHASETPALKQAVGAGADPTAPTRTDTTDDAKPAQPAEQPADNMPKSETEPEPAPVSNDTSPPAPTNAADGNADIDASTGSATADSTSNTENTDAAPKDDTQNKPEESAAPTAEPAADAAQKQTDTSTPKPTTQEPTPT
jgi:hypothetical protein